MKQKIRLTESQLHNVIRKCVNEALNEYKNKDTERFNTTGEIYDYDAGGKSNSRIVNHYFDGSKEYLYHNKGVANALNYKCGRVNREYDGDDYDNYYLYNDDQYLYDHPTCSRGKLGRQRPQLSHFNHDID